MEQTVSMRRSIWTSSLITLVGLAVFIGVTAFLPPPAGRTGLIMLGVFLAVVPASVWLAFFYQQDRAEPEPKRLVIRVFAFGAVAAALVPFLTVFQTDTIGVFPNIVVRFLLTLLTVALIQEVLKVAMVRYVVLGTREFDRITDGMVYGLASGLGFATVLTVLFVIQSDGVVPLAGGIRAVNNALVHGALGAVSGFYIGRVKIDGKNLLWMFNGLAVVTVGNAFYTVASDAVSSSLTFNPWYSLGVSVLLALAVGGVLYWIFQRATLRDTGALETVSMQINARSKVMPWDIHVRYDILMLSALALAAVVSTVTVVLAGRGTTTYTGDAVQVTFDFPNGWAVESSQPGEWSARNLTGAGTFKPTITVLDQKTRPDADLGVLVVNLTTALQQERSLFVELERTTEGITVDGQPAVRVTYRYAREGVNGPVIVQGVDTYVISGDRLLTLRYEAQDSAFATGLADYERLLDSTAFVER